MKKISRFLIFVSVLLVMFQMPVHAKQKTISLTDHVLTLSVGEKAKLSIPGVKQSDIQWNTSNKKICKISNKGVVTAKKIGKVNITAKYKDAAFKIKVTVYPKNGFFNEIIAEDENIVVYLHSIRKGQIYIKVKNKTDKDFRVGNRQYDYNGEMHDDNPFSVRLSKNAWCGFKVTFQDPDNVLENVKYTYSGGVFDCVMNYYTDSDTSIDYYTVQFTINK